MSLAENLNITFHSAFKDLRHQVRMAINHQSARTVSLSSLDEPKSSRILKELINAHAGDQAAMDDIRQGINEGLMDVLDSGQDFYFNCMPKQAWRMVDIHLLARAATFSLQYGKNLDIFEAESFFDLAEESPQRWAGFIKEMALLGYSFIVSQKVEIDPEGNNYGVMVYRRQNGNFYFRSGCNDHPLKYMIDYYDRMGGEKGRYRRLRAIPTIMKLLIEQGEVAQAAHRRDSLTAVQKELTARLSQIDRLGLGEVIKPAMRMRIENLVPGIGG